MHGERSRGGRGRPARGACRGNARGAASGRRWHGRRGIIVGALVAGRGSITNVEARLGGPVGAHRIVVTMLGAQRRALASVVPRARGPRRRERDRGAHARRGRRSITYVAARARDPRPSDRGHRGQAPGRPWRHTGRHHQASRPAFARWRSSRRRQAPVVARERSSAARIRTCRGSMAWPRRTWPSDADMTVVIAATGRVKRPMTAVIGNEGLTRTPLDPGRRIAARRRPALGRAASEGVGAGLSWSLIVLAGR